jgi:mono/diheme cytochrome c family protein
MTKQVFPLLAAAVLAAWGSASAAPAAGAAPAAADPKPDLLAAETAAWQAAKPAFEKACATCHTSAGKKATKKKLAHFNFDAYPLGGHHTATIGFTIREVLGLSGKKPTMPFDKPGAVKGDDLASIKAWSDAWEAAEKAGVHRATPATHDHH